jgi:hypothetical protein
MKKLLTLLFAGAMFVSLAMPVFAQDSSAPADSSSSMGKHKKEKKTKVKKEKKSKKSKTESSTPPQ